MSPFWNAWVWTITLVVILGCTLLLLATRRSEPHKEATEETLGHTFDGIEEYDNPLPSWWFQMFVGTVIFAVAYLGLYGLANVKGFYGWSSVGQYEEEMAHAEEVYKPVFAKYASLSIEDLQGKPDGLKIGQRMFANNCAVCHGGTGAGAHGFPNLTDNDWLYGGAPATIQQTITEGRQGAMPAWGPVLGEEGVRDVTSYILSLSGAEHDADMAARGQQQFQALCTACHGADGKGTQALGAPNLTDNTWLYGGSFEQISHTIRTGRNGVMPAHKALLSDDKIKLIAAYVYSLSNK
ncbi:cytochrome-c oxidase, cbb3-type subunit III [Amphritea sp. 2_MG-2023]|jgi:cytochrome c oxidase cbb3-type subunit 3|uniref:cytochrome-c oxidase, cbb3-type subunit III n=1 Tax=Amphritea TaxID=515417 RepID=UPI001C073D42|nr:MULTISPECIES: cytochrome-c oxidase, cbb3-type subunit III [Amphritea]MBU2964456.1 cytochrome-c oxidase, cbb3-type subunit III [Amphritea atlantica]MDO6417784.1 cytochrome-c oxidase, cbb3-type subunit III [Amphritea sp. 2_MG-2023]MDX2421250.1 cytochrome-c oxidase, cbb3-type subunit III [Amphritea sp.]